MLRLIFMGTPEFAVPSLEALYKKGYPILGVFTQPDRKSGRGLELKPSPVKAKALELGLPIFQPQSLSQTEIYEKLRSLSPDLIVVVAYGQILKKNVLDLPSKGCVNLHSSLLPRWRGAAPIVWAILSGDKETGVTTQKMAEKLDAGEILLQSKTAISPQENAKTLHDRLSLLGADLILKTLEGIESGKLRATAQDEQLVTYASKLKKEMEILDLSRTGADLERQIRALNPWPGTSLWVGRERLKIKEAVLRKDIQGFQGMLFEKAGMLLLGSSDGSLELKRLQWEGKKEVTPAEFLNGLRGRSQKLPIEVGSEPK